MNGWRATVTACLFALGGCAYNWDALQPLPVDAGDVSTDAFDAGDAIARDVIDAIDVNGPCGTLGQACCNGRTACNTGTCTNGTCQCPMGETACGGQCVNTQTSTAHCGMCGFACSTVNGTAACVTGICTITCNTGFANCDGNLVNGCETNTRTDAMHCGACATSCAAGANQTASCTNGTCATSCAAGFGDCNMNTADGCETALVSDPSNCGTCGHTCSLPNATSTCSSGTCAVMTCNTGFGDCNSIPSDGCESNLTTDPAHCGACTMACAFANATATCNAGACALGTCSAGFQDCDTMPSNGCEAAVATDPNNCGTCGTVCPTGEPLCIAGVCSANCTAPMADCGTGGCNVDLNTDPSHCGNCATMCSTVNDTPTCVAGMCHVTCSTGFGDCDMSAATGCETNLQLDSNNCGMCGHRCTGGHPTCTGGTCV